MNNNDLKRFFPDCVDKEMHDFVRLDENGKIPVKELPSFVDDVVEGYYHASEFYEQRTGSGTEEDPYVYTKLMAHEKGKIYVDIPTGLTFRWSGTVYIQIGGCTVEQLLDILKGSDWISVDANEAETEVIVKPDSEYTPFIIELTGSSGTLTDAEIAEVLVSKECMIINGDEVYRISHIEDNFIQFTHTSRDNNAQSKIKNIYVYTSEESTLTYKTWVKLELNIRGLYKHTIVNSNDLTFTIISHQATQLTSIDLLRNNFDLIVSASYSNSKGLLVSHNDVGQASNYVSIAYYNIEDDAMATTVICNGGAIEITSDTVVEL